jgi:hypothetical protein
MMHLSRERAIFVCHQLFKQLRNRYGRKHIFADSVPNGIMMPAGWLLRLKHTVYDTEMKNMMERFIQQIKDRIENFRRPFSMQEEKLQLRAHVWNWLKLFV